MSTRVMKEMVCGNHGARDCSKEELMCQTHVQQVDQYLKVLRKANWDLGNSRPISQCLDDLLTSLQSIYKTSKNFSSAEGLKVDKQNIIVRIDDLFQFYSSLGTHGTSLFYEKNEEYQKLKARSYAICCTCCIRTPFSEDLGELKDALPYKELHVVDENEVIAYEALKKDEEDERGAHAQEAFNIAYVESEKKYYHVFNIEDPREYNPLENRCCLIKDGVLLKLPVCDECFDRMKKASNYLKEFEEIWDDLSENEQQSIKEKAIAMLKRLS